MPLRVLIVENEPLIALDLQGILEGAGHVVVGRAATLEEAVALGRRGRPDVAVVDMQLDDGDTGLDVAVALHAQDRVRPLFLTGRSDFYVRAMSLDFEPLGYLTKPFDAAELLATLARVQARA